VAACDPLVARLGGIVVGVYADAVMSGYRRDRVGLARLLEDVKLGVIDIVVAESVDRLARDAEDVAFIGKQFRYFDVALHTTVEGEMDDVKLAVAGMLGGLFLKNLQAKTLRGMEAAMVAGKIVTGPSYGYRRALRFDAKGTPITGIFEIDDKAAAIVRRIYEEFASGRSSRNIATRLNADGIAAPRGGPWNASSIRGDPKKYTGIINNPLYAGRLIWMRREWRRDPNSSTRARRYRMRDESEWHTIEVPDLRIVDQSIVEAAQAELARNRRAPDEKLAQKRRTKHLLSGLIKCGTCGSSYTLTSRDYYGCAGVKERGNCDNRTTVRKALIEETVLAALQADLLTPKMAELFETEFRREVERAAKRYSEFDPAVVADISRVEAELGNLSANLLAGVVGPTMMTMIAAREAELAALKARQAANRGPTNVTIVPHAILVKRYEEKVARLREALSDELINVEAAQTLAGLLEQITVMPSVDGVTEIEVVALTRVLSAFASNENTPRRGSDEGCPITVVAGTGFEPVTFRL
jgi:site-specific DNA recombinase